MSVLNVGTLLLSRNETPTLQGTQGNPFLSALFFTMVNLLMKT